MTAHALLLAVSKKTDAAARHQTPVRSNSSDYGEFDDEDLDVSLLDVFDSKPEIAVSNPKNGSASVRRPPDPPSQSLAQTGPDLNASESFDTSTLKDEFDDSDEDMFAADLEDIVAKFDTQNSAGGHALPASKNTNRISEADSDDEFGDGGLDEQDFEAAEVAATQSIKQTANSLLPVRAKFS